MADGQGLADLLSGAAGAPVNRPALNSFIATSQAKNGLVSAQTQDAMIKASQAQEQMQAWDNIKTSLMANGARESDAQLVRDAIVGANDHNAINAENMLKASNAAVLSNPGLLGTSAQTAAQQGIQGKVAEPVALPNSFTQLPGTPQVNAQQSPQGAAQTAQTRALTGLDVARAEDEHAKAKNAMSASTLSPAGLDEAAAVTMADPSKMSTYAGYGASGQKNKDAINNRRAQILNAAGMTTDDMIRQRAITKASVGAAGQAAKQMQTLDAFTPLVKANGDRINQLLDQIDATGGGGGVDEPIINGFERMVGRKLNSDDLTELHSVFAAYQAEVGRLLAAGPSMNGVISDHARDLVNGMAPETMSSTGARRVLNRIDTEIGIRHQGVVNSLNEAAAAQLPVISPHQPGNAPAAAGASDDGLPPGFHRLN